MDVDGSSVEISSALVDRIERRLPESDFETVSGYVEFVLVELLDDLEEDSPEDDLTVEERMESLGYKQE